MMVSLRNYSRCLGCVGTLNPNSIANTAHFHTGTLTFREFRPLNIEGNRETHFFQLLRNQSRDRKGERSWKWRKRQGRDIHLTRPGVAKGISLGLLSR